MSRQNVFKTDLACIRTKLNLKQSDSARKCGKTQSFIAKIESTASSKRNISIDDFETLERAYDCKIDLRIIDKDGNTFII